MRTVINQETAQLAKDRGLPQDFNFWSIDCDISFWDINERLNKPQWRLDYYGEAATAYLTAPTQEILKKWLREVHGIDIIVYPSFMGTNANYYYLIIKDRDFDNTEQGETNNYGYEEAFELGLVEALKLV